MPPATTTWSRSGTVVLQANRHFGRDATRTSRRLKVVSFGHVIVIQSNHEVEVVCWFLEQALPCSSRFVGVLLAFPEEFGGIPVSGPAIICELHQWSTACCSIPLRARGTTRSVRAGLHYHLESFLGTTTALPMHGSSLSSAGNKRA